MTILPGQNLKTKRLKIVRNDVSSKSNNLIVSTSTILGNDQNTNVISMANIL